MVEDGSSPPRSPEVQAVHRLKSRVIRCADACDNYPPAHAGQWHKPRGARARLADKCGAPCECGATRLGACLPRGHGSTGSKHDIRAFYPPALPSFIGEVERTLTSAPLRVDATSS